MLGDTVPEHVQEVPELSSQNASLNAELGTIVARIRAFIDPDGRKSELAHTALAGLFGPALKRVNDQHIRCGCESCTDFTGPNYPFIEGVDNAITTAVGNGWGSTTGFPLQQPTQEEDCLLWNWLRDQCAGDFSLPLPRQADEHPSVLPESFDMLTLLGAHADQGIDFNNNTPSIALPWLWRIRKAPYRMQLGFYRLIWHMTLLLRAPLGSQHPNDVFASEAVFQRCTSFNQWFRCDKGSFFPSSLEIPEEREYLRHIVSECVACARSANKHASGGGAGRVQGGVQGREALGGKRRRGE
jgi:hypothetical protein